MLFIPILFNTPDICLLISAVLSSYFSSLGLSLSLDGTKSSPYQVLLFTACTIGLTILFSIGLLGAKLFDANSKVSFKSPHITSEYLSGSISSLFVIKSDIFVTAFCITATVLPFGILKNLWSPILAIM